MTTYILLSHDVDWGKSGAPISHVMARKDRFDEETIKNIKKKNPYYNIPELLELESKYDVKSTFFFRTNVKNSKHPPPPYKIEDYKSDMRSMLSGGWEIALHSDYLSFDDITHLKKEKTELENTAGTKIFGNRIHYTLTDMKLYQNLEKLNFKYDSSAKYSREQFVEKDFGYFIEKGIIIYPITFMDALIFTHFAKSEADVVKTIKKAIEIAENLPNKNRIITVLWHNCVLKMKYGRKYGDILEYLTSLRNIEVKRGIDLVNLIEKGEL